MDFSKVPFSYIMSQQVICITKKIWAKTVLCLLSSLTANVRINFFTYCSEALGNGGLPAVMQETAAAAL
jgi:hypothetical protein